MGIQKEQAYASCFLLPENFILSIMLVKPFFIF